MTANRDEEQRRHDPRNSRAAASPRSRQCCTRRLLSDLGRDVELVRFIREPNPFPSFSGEESLIVRFETLDEDQTALYCYLQDLYEGAQLRPERLREWHELRSGYGGRDESLVVDGSLQPLAPTA